MLNTCHKWNITTQERMLSIVEDMLNKAKESNDTTTISRCKNVLDYIKTNTPDRHDIEYYGDDIEYIHLTEEQLQETLTKIITQ